MKVTSEIKNLMVTHPRVQFVDGVADVSAEDAELLRSLEGLGVSVPDAPKPRRRKAADDGNSTVRDGR
jgi:hypothetical protein